LAAVAQSGDALRHANETIRHWATVSKTLGTPLTYELAVKMRTPELKTHLADISYRGRSKLRVPEMPTALCEACGLRPGEDASCTAAAFLSALLE